jgi:hypothetical protein
MMVAGFRHAGMPPGGILAAKAAEDHGAVDSRGHLIQVNGAPPPHSTIDAS